MLIKHFEDGSAVKIHIDKVGAPANVMFSNIMCFAARDIKIDKGQVQHVPINYCIPYRQNLQISCCCMMMLVLTANCLDVCMVSLELPVRKQNIY